jgi:DNA-binding LacI/PurR family transcriptional regulator
MEIKRNTTRKDIAREAGVSVSVVSRALNNSGYVEKEKRQQILEIANRLGYSLNPVAMALQQNRTHQLLCVCNDLILSGTFFSQVFHGMVREAEARGYHVLAAMDVNDMSRVKTFLADGVLFPMEAFAQAYAETVGKNYHLPAVSASFDSDITFERPIPIVAMDNDKVINDIIDYLQKMGHRKIGMVWHENTLYSRRRYNYWKRRMTLELGQDAEIYSVPVGLGDTERGENADCFHWNFAEDSNNYYAAGRQAAEFFDQMRCKPTAVICFDDDMAIGMMTALQRMGYDIPDDLSIVGIDGTQTRTLFSPILTSMSTVPEEQGALCVDTLISMLEGRPYKYVRYVTGKLLEGETVKKLV